MFDHVTIRVSDREASRRFYGTGLRVLGREATHESGEYTEWGDFGLAAVRPGRPLTRRLHVAFAAPDREHVDAWWRELVAAGYRDDGAPGVRLRYHESYYGAFVLDPDGNSVEAVHHHTTDMSHGTIDHLWLRVADVTAAKRFYETVCPVVGWRVVHDSADRVRFTDGRGSFAIVAGAEATEHVHLAFGVPEAARVEEFHRVALAAGYRDNGPPGVRPEYHAGYHGAFVLDPDGNNVEAVFHDRSAR